jgi:uncharacterized membrane protein
LAYPPHVFGTQPAGNVPASYLDDCFNAAAPLASPTFTGTPAAPTPASSDSSTTLATTAFVQAAVGSLGSQPFVRQTVAAGPVTAAGLPNFLPATSVNLNLTSQNITGTAALVCTAANGWSQTTGAQANIIGISTSNLTWTGLTNTATNYLYVTISGAVLTTGFTTVVPVYQWGGTPAVTAGLFTFNISTMTGYLGNGSTAPQTNLVMVGEAVAAAGAITSTVAYAYNGTYDSGLTATLPTGGATTVSHNIGVYPRLWDLILQNTTGEQGYSVGDQISVRQILNNGAAGGIAFRVTAKTAVFGVAAAWTTSSATGASAPVSLTVADWSYKVIASRGW